MVKSGKGERESEREGREREEGRETSLPFSLYSPHYFLNPGVGGAQPSVSMSLSMHALFPGDPWEELELHESLDMWTWSSRALCYLSGRPTPVLGR